jgi:hypothetical protein
MFQEFLDYCRQNEIIKDCDMDRARAIIRGEV